MATIKEEAQAYEPKRTSNIADLPQVSVDLVMKDDEFEVEENGKSKIVKQKVVQIGDERYRVPATVLKQLKEHLKENPNLNLFKVNSTGTGMQTTYTVIPIHTPS